jgi:hypothetical protein
MPKSKVSAYLLRLVCSDQEDIEQLETLALEDLKLGRATPSRSWLLGRKAPPFGRQALDQLSVGRRYLIRPKADEDLDDQAPYYPAEGSPALGHSFLVAAHEIFALSLPNQKWAWSPKIQAPSTYWRTHLSDSRTR